MNLEEALDKLYAAPLEEFTSTRNELATQLGPDGAQLKALKKPNTAAWAVNQLVRQRPDDIDELFSVTDQLRIAQRRVLSGSKPSELRKAGDERNRLISRLSGLAEKILSDAGHGASTSTMSAVHDSLVAVASDPDGAELLRRGRLTRELEPGAFVDAGGGLTIVPDQDADDARPKKGADLAALHAAREAINAARDALKTAKDAAKAATTELRRAEREADEAERKAKAAREEAEFAARSHHARRADVEGAEEVLAKAQDALKELG